MPATPPPQSSNLLGDAVVESRQQFRKLMTQLERLANEGYMEEGRKLLPKLEKLAHEVLRILNPRDPVERKYRAQIQRDLERVQKALKKSWGGAVGVGLLALIVGSILGIVIVGGILYMAFA